MTRLRTMVTRALVVALLLLTIGGGIANAAGPQAGGFRSVPDDPGYGLRP